MATKSKLWCGFLEAGDKASPVVRDSTLDTGNPATVYLFNFKRSAILEYRKTIVEELLRELTKDEEPLAADLRKEYKRVRAGFTPRRERQLRPPTRVRRAAQETEESGDDDFDDDAPTMPAFDDDSAPEADPSDA